MCDSTGLLNEAILVGTDPSNHWRCRLGRTILLLLLDHEMKTSELAGVALNTAVHNLAFPDVPINDDCTAPPYSTDWAFGGPIIEREGIDIQPLGNQYQGTQWRACGAFISPTPLIAAMRCYVASNLGDTVDIPEELT